VQRFFTKKYSEKFAEDKRKSVVKNIVQGSKNFRFIAFHIFIRLIFPDDIENFPTNLPVRDLGSRKLIEIYETIKRDQTEISQP
jgi:hypothetical protein